MDEVESSQNSPFKNKQFSRLRWTEVDKYVSCGLRWTKLHLPGCSSIFYQTRPANSEEPNWGLVYSTAYLFDPDRCAYLFDPDRCTDHSIQQVLAVVASRRRWDFQRRVHLARIVGRNTKRSSAILWGYVTHSGAALINEGKDRIERSSLTPRNLKGFKRTTLILYNPFPCAPVAWKQGMCILCLRCTNVD